MAVKVRTLTGEEAQELTRLAHARTVPHRLVQRAQIIWASAQGRKAPAIARHVEFLRGMYRAKRDTMLAALAAAFADWPEVTWTRPRGTRPCRARSCQRGR